MKKISKFTQILLIQYLVIVTVLMLLYKSGSLFSKNATHYLLDQNYLSDLGRTVSFSGNAHNPYWFVYSITLFLVGIGTILFFYLTAKHFQQKNKIMTQLLGIIAGIGYMGIAVFPVDTSFYAHILSGKIAYFSFFFASVSLLVYSQKRAPKNILFWLDSLNILLFLFLLLTLFGPHSSESVSALQLKTIAQKIMVSAQLIIPYVLLKHLDKKTTQI